MWKLTIEEVDGEPALVFPEDVLEALGVGEGDGAATQQFRRLIATHSRVAAVIDMANDPVTALRSASDPQV